MNTKGGISMIDLYLPLSEDIEELVICNTRIINVNFVDRSGKDGDQCKEQLLKREPNGISL